MKIDQPVVHSKPDGMTDREWLGQVIERQRARVECAKDSGEDQVAANCQRVLDRLETRLNSLPTDPHPKP